jgi:hypothetical protein
VQGGLPIPSFRCGPVTLVTFGENPAGAGRLLRRSSICGSLRPVPLCVGPIKIGDPQPRVRCDVSDYPRRLRAALDCRRAHRSPAPTPRETSDGRRRAAEPSRRRGRFPSTSRDARLPSRQVHEMLTKHEEPTSGGQEGSGARMKARQCSSRSSEPLPSSRYRLRLRYSLWPFSLFLSDASADDS